MKTFFSLTHSSQDYNVSLDLLANRKKDPADAYTHIDTDQIMLSAKKRVSDYKQDFQDYKAQGGTDKQKEFLNEAAKRDFGGTWDQVIEFAKSQMVKEYGVMRDWVTDEDIRSLISLANSGHAEAAYTLGRQLMKQGEDRAVEWLVKSHNFGHIGALFALSGYLSQNGNTTGAIACLVISADKGNEIAQLAIFHFEKVGYMFEANLEELIKTLDELSEKTPYSTARYLKLVLLMLTGKDSQAFKLLNNLIAYPLNPPKKKDWDAEYENRTKMLQRYLKKLKDGLQNNNGETVTIAKRAEVIQRVSAEFSFIPFSDFIELDDAAQETYQALR